MSLVRRQSQQKMEIDALEGWLLKKKSKDSISLLSSDNRRWFKIKEMKGLEQVELALCYFKSQRDKEARGWMYLKDVTQIFDDERTFTIVSVARSITMEAQNQAEHKFWLRGLVSLCPQANISGLKTEINFLKGKESKEEKLVSDISMSRQSESKDESAGADVKNCENINANGRNRAMSEADRSSRPSSRASSPGRDAVKKKNDPSDSEEQSSVGSRADRSEREDHRLSGSGYRNGGGATSRLHDHIRGDQDRSSPERLAAEVKEEGDCGDDEEMQNSCADDLETEDLNQMPSKKATSRQQRRVGGGYIAGTTDSDRKEFNEGSEGKTGDEERGPSSTAEAGPAMGKPKKRPPPAPKDAPPRRARDVLLDEDEKEGVNINRTTRQSIEDLLVSGGGRSRANSREQADSKGVGDDEEVEDVDFKVERERRGSHGSLVIATALVAGANPAALISPAVSNRPPRPPAGAKPPYVQKKSPSTAQAAGSSRSSTPPRQAADPGSAVDSNFVSEDWDEDANEEMHMADGKAVRGIIGKSAKNLPGQLGVDGGVKADTNWIEDDFDT